MKLLALESSTKLASVAIVENGSTLVEMTSPDQRAHSEFLNDAVQKCLAVVGLSFQQIDGFAVGKGPGSFTGIRVALNLAKAFAYSLDKPVYAFDSLEVLHEQAQMDCACIINAYKNMVYFSVFQKGLRILEPVAIPILNLEKRLIELIPGVSENQKILLVGDGFSFYESVFSSHLEKMTTRNAQILDFPLASTMGRMAASQSYRALDWKSLIPLYIRASEAEENLQRK